VCGLQSTPKKTTAPSPQPCQFWSLKFFLECYSPKPSCVTNIICYIATTAAEVISGVLPKPISLPNVVLKVVFCILLIEPKLCTKFTIASFNSCKTSRGAKFFGMLPLPISRQFWYKNLFLMWYFPNTRCVEFEVTNFNGCRNK